MLEDELVFDDGEKAAVYCGWQNTYHPESRICDFDLSLFEELPNGSYRRADEHQQERCYTMEEIKEALQSNHLELIGVWADYHFSPTQADTPRWYFAARAIK